MVWDAFMEDEEVQTLKETPLMVDLVNTIKERKTMRQKDDNLDKLKARNATVLRREIKLAESKYLELWEKFNKNKDYTESFLAINSQLSFMYLKFEEIEAKLIEYVHPLVLKQTKLQFEYLRLEEKYENSSEILKERKKLRNEKNDIFNRRNCEEIEALYPQSIASRRTELKIARGKFLESWKQYGMNSNIEEKSLKTSGEYAKILSTVKDLEIKIKELRETKPYLKMLRENYIRDSILEEKFLDSQRGVESQ
jgi:hypothetical protein